MDDQPRRRFVRRAAAPTPGDCAQIPVSTMALTFSRGGRSALCHWAPRTVFTDACSQRTSWNYYFGGADDSILDYVTEQNVYLYLSYTRYYRCVM